MRKLEEWFERELVVVGVHSGKYHAERVTANIRQAALRLGLNHPVVNDRQFRVWRSYAVTAWPTLVLIDPEGYVVGVQPGEVTAEALAPAIERVIKDAEGRGKLRREPLEFLAPESVPPLPAGERGTSLAFPGKVLATPDGQLFVADSGHNRVLVVALDADGRGGEVRAVVGSGGRGFADGDFATCEFDYPQGMALVGDTPDRQILYVADAENHAIRAIDLAGGQVSTVAGTGEQARRFNVAGSALQTPLSSPWDVVHVPSGAGGDGKLYVAMAGTHQLWAIDLARDEARPYAGSGAEDIHDGGLRSAALAQPMGLTTDGRRLYFADSESSGVRWADLPPGGQVGTIVGTGLFDFGDVDGAGDSALLQHDQGICWSDGRLYVADSYNQKVKVVDIGTRRATTFLGDGQPGLVDGDAPRFWEPAGLCALGDRLFIADTNNHAVRVADLQTGRVWTLELRG